MKEFVYKITDPMGMHARPAGEFVKEVTSYGCKVTISKGEKSVDATRIFGVMGLVIKCGDEVKVSIEGPDEDALVQKLEKFMTENL